jgi:hypothetical protein
MKHLKLLSTVLGLLAVCCGGENLYAQGSTAFSYQGHLLVSGNPATGNFDLTFTVFDSSSGGNLIGGPLPTPAVGVANGLFNVVLDFGANVFTGSARWLEIAVRPSGSSSAYTTLAPRQALLPAPYAIFANTAGNLYVTNSSETWTTLPIGTVNGFPAPPGTTLIGGASASSVTWSNTFYQNTNELGTSLWNLENGFAALSSTNSNYDLFLGDLLFVGASGLSALQIYDTP